MLSIKEKEINRRRMRKSGISINDLMILDSFIFNEKQEFISEIINVDISDLNKDYVIQMLSDKTEGFKRTVYLINNVIKLSLLLNIDIFKLNELIVERRFVLEYIFNSNSTEIVKVNKIVAELEKAVKLSLSYFYKKFIKLKKRGNNYGTLYYKTFRICFSCVLCFYVNSVFRSSKLIYFQVLLM